jgi:stage V sporulation protein G
VEITEVRVKLMEEAGERLQAFCSITFDDAFVVRDLKIIEGSTGPFVAMPSRKLTAHCPQCGCKNHLRAAYCNQCGARQREQHTQKDDDGRVKLYADIAHPINSGCREIIQQRVIQAFEEEKARSKLPGYIPTYDDLDDDVTWTPPHAPHSPAADPAGTTYSGPAAKFQTPKIEPAGPSPGGGQPRGPHHPPTAPRRVARPETRVNDSFGAGIFE